MAAPNPAEIRNVAVIGTSASGKTTLIERLLFTAGATKRMGTVEEGTAVADYTDEAKKHKHSLSITPVRLAHGGVRATLLDTPGLADFLGHAASTLVAVESVLVVVDAIKGVDSTTRRLMSMAEARGTPRVIVVNKIDSGDADLERVVESIRSAFGTVCLPITLPADGRKKVINVFESDHADGTPDLWSVEEAHTKIVEQVIEVDDELMSVYFEKGAAGLDPARVHAAFEKALVEGHLIPICFVSAKSGAGAEALLGVIEHYCPSPAEGAPRVFSEKTPDGADRPVTPDVGSAAAPAIAHVFKVTADPFVGKLALFRVLQGTIRTRAELHVNGANRPVRVGHMFTLHGKDHAEVHEAGPGEIAAVSKIDELRYNAVVTADPGRTLRPPPLAMPRPMFGLAVELKNHADEAKFAAACHKLQEEDPCLVVDRIAATRQTVVRGLGELHLRVVLERLKDAFGIEVTTSRPKVAYKETITAKADGHHRHKKQTGGAGQFGEVYLRVEPLPADSPEGFEFVSEVVGGTVPRQFWPAVEKGCRQIYEAGAIAGYPMHGVRVALTDGKYHEVDSKEVAFVTAGKKAFIDAVQKARPKLLEPYVVLEITIPSSHVGTIAGDLSTKRGRVQETQLVGSDTSMVRAVAPLGEVQNYANELKSMTGGSGTFTMDYSHDEHTPPQVQAAVVAAYKPHPDED